MVGAGRFHLVHGRDHRIFGSQWIVISTDVLQHLVLVSETMPQPSPIWFWVAGALCWVSGGLCLCAGLTKWFWRGHPYTVKDDFGGSVVFDGLNGGRRYRIVNVFERRS